MGGPAIETTGDDWPGVSVIMPVRNEERHLAAAVRRVLEQDYRGPLEIIVAVGPGRDRTEEIARELARSDPRLVVLENPAGRTPHALNLAIRAARHEVIVRVDGHGELGDHYLERAVALLHRTGAANVGGVMDARGETPFQEAVAYAYVSHLGLGGSTFHLESSAEGPADTVFLGAFRKDALTAVGGFDETMHRAQDWELNYRLRGRGEMVWFSPELKVTYRPRSTLRSLMSQMYETGRWRREVVRRYPETANPRYLAPPATITALALGTVSGLVGVITGSRWLRTGFAAPIGYFALVLAGTLAADRRLGSRARLRLPLVLIATHLSWGAGFLVGLGGHASAPEERRG